MADMRYCSECGSEYNATLHPKTRTTADGTGCIYCNPNEQYKEYRDPLAVAARKANKK